MASGDPLLFLIFLAYALILMGIGYILFRVYRNKTRKVRKLR